MTPVVGVWLTGVIVAPHPLGTSLFALTVKTGMDLIVTGGVLPPVHLLLLLRVVHPHPLHLLPQVQLTQPAQMDTIIWALITPPVAIA